MDSPEKKPMFTGRELLLLILPLIIEQTLAIAVGMVDTAMVSGCGEAAISAVSLVDSINTLLIQLFSAMSAGGAIIAAQYIGNQDKRNACAAAKQLFISIFLIAAVVASAALIFSRPLLSGIFGSIEQAIMDQAQTYFLISALSYPFLALYNSGAGVLRAMGNTKSTMYISLLMNVINVVGNYFLIHPAHTLTLFGTSSIYVWGAGLGVGGAAWASLAARAFAALVVVKMLLNHSLPIHISEPLKLKPDLKMVRRILHIGLPNGLENSLFQVGKLIIAGLIATFPTSVITANSVSNSVSGLVNIPGNGIALATITVIGQCMGAGELAQAKRYAKKLTSWMVLSLLPMNIIMFFFPGVFIGFYQLSSDAATLSSEMMRQYAVFDVLMWMTSFGLPSVLRAAGDVRFTMTVSILSMLICRLAFSYLFVLVFGMGLMGVWYAMYCDWFVRSVFFVWRFFSGRWQRYKVI